MISKPQRREHGIESTSELNDCVFFKRQNMTLYEGDSASIMSKMPEESVDCIITSPPYYGQRDYKVDGQIGLESHPSEYLSKLIASFEMAKAILKTSGSLWVIIGDTYWSGKGRPTSPDSKQRHRRFDRPQDRTGQGPWCVPKQQLLIPHRFAIAMQDAGWIVRNDNIWVKQTPMPDPVEDRSALTHEFVFHFVKAKHYYYDMRSVAVPSFGSRSVKAPSSVWSVPTTRSKKQHSAVFPEQLVIHPILATCPPNGVLLDPFCGSGTTLKVAKSIYPICNVIGIDISNDSLKEACLLVS